MTDRERAERLFQEHILPDLPYMAKGEKAYVTEQITNAILAAFREVRGEERERCAKIADAPLMHRKGRLGLWRQRRAQIAAAIRSPAPPGADNG